MKNKPLIPVGTVMIDVTSVRRIGTVIRSGPTTAWCEDRLKLVVSGTADEFIAYRRGSCIGRAIPEDHPLVAELREHHRIRHLAHAVRERIPPPWSSMLSTGDYAKKHGADVLKAAEALGINIPKTP